MPALQRNRGQALILVVLVMFVVIGLAALFVSLVHLTLTQSARHTIMLELQQISEAGVRYADYQLTYSAEGADWRPDPDPYGSRQYDYGRGNFRLWVEYYGAVPTDPLSKFIRITSEARMPGNPYLSYKLVAYKPILITDYARFVTNLSHSAIPAQLGVPNIEWYNPVTQRNEIKDYPVDIAGGIRVNGDLEWFGTVAVSVAGNDKVEVAGDISHMGTTVTVNGNVVYPSADPLFTTLTGTYRDGRNAAGADGLPRWIRYIPPPQTDLPEPWTGRLRYLLLTRDSGVWRVGAVGAFNDGWYGYGQGIFVDNYDDIQYNHDYEQLLADWMKRGGAGGSGWDAGKKIYTPPGVEVILHGEASPPTIELIRRDGQSWHDRTTGNPLPGDRLVLGWPANGVLMAAGNIRIKGTLPTGEKSLTAVSGGTVYIEGSTPSLGNSRLALLARDSVCLNTTAIAGGGSQTAADFGNDLAGNSYWQITPGNQLRLSFKTGASGAVSLRIRHAGYGSDWELGNDTVIKMIVNGQTYQWGGSSSTYKFSTIYSDTDTTSSKVYPLWEEKEFVLDTDISDPTLYRGVTIYPNANNQLTLELDSTSENTYVVSSAAVVGPGVDTLVNALIYAQTGSWFVIPGDWFDPATQQPLPINITVNGAISENRTAPVGYVSEWLSKWSGDPSQLGGPRFNFYYDSGLRAAVGGRPRLPRLPVSPGLIVWGERM